MVCYQGNWVNAPKVITKNLTFPCSPNPCRNGGLCEVNNINPNRYSCSCSPNFTGITFI